MNKQQIIQKLSYIATNFEDTDALRSSLFRFISEIAQEGVTLNQTYSARSFPIDVRQEIVLRDHFTCTYCNRTGEIDGDPDGELWNIDHIVPWSKGGSTSVDNGVLSCKKCNSDKRDMTPAQYLKWLRFSLLQKVEDDALSDTCIDDTEKRSGIDESLASLYIGNGWDEFCEGYFQEYPNATQAELRRVMSSLDGREPDTFKTEAFRYFHRLSPNGKPQMAERT